MKNCYTIHLGFNTNSPLIGSIWSDETQNETYHFLQYALAKVPPPDPGTPEWFKFKTGDEISVVVWDLSSSPEEMDLDLQMALSYLDAPPQTYNPSDYITILPASAAAVPPVTNGRYYLEFSGFGDGSHSSSSLSPWGNCSWWYRWSGSMSFTATINCKISFHLCATPSGSSSGQKYITDPEVIVGAGD